jgi:1-phosphofructokinase
VATNEEFKLVNQGPSVTPDQEASLLAIVENMNSDDILFVSGSHPEGITRATYEKIAKASQQRGFKFILDTSAHFVPELLSYKPYLIKPNDEELAEWFGLKDISLEEIKDCGRKLLEQGAQNVIVSLGDKGAILFTPTETIHVTAPDGEVVNTACAGDTLLATFVGSQLQGLSDEEALIKAVAAGSSTAFRPGLTDFKDVPTLMQQIKRVS